MIFKNPLLDKDELFHYGTPRHSGRYPYGSGKNPYQHESNFLNDVQKLKDEGYSGYTELAKAMGMSTGDFRAKLTNENHRIRAMYVADAKHLYFDEGLSATEIGRRMGKNESSIRSLLNDSIAERQAITKNTSDILKQNVDKYEFIDVGVGVENRIGISKTRLDAAVKALKDEGYHVENIQVDQLGTADGNKTTIKILCGPNSTWNDARLAVKNDKVRLIDEHTEDCGRTYLNIKPPVSVDSKRVDVKYAEDGGTNMDGVIELRRGVPDISLGNARYAQVRIAVDGTHYLKGMAIYSDDLPKGVDIRFNTNKHKGTPMLGESDNTVLKPLKRDKRTGEVNKENPFGASIKEEDSLRMVQRTYLDKNGERKQSAINVVNEEGDWENWSRNLASQFLSKQPVELAKRQLDIVKKNQEEEYKDISSLTNPAVKKKLLESFASDCDSKAVHLKAAALPRQQTHVILPLPNVRANEVYAPNYRNGEKVVLIRYPHGGKFEIPELTVNNKNSKARSIIGSDASDAIGIHPKVAEQLSGADFDGDSVVVIPVNNKVRINVSKPLEGLKDFDPKERYPKYPGMQVISGKQKQTEMGKVSNLITDMTLRDAPEEDIVRAVKHSMVVIDAEKHELNWKQSEKDNQIKALKKKYQGSPTAGASTLLSRASATKRVPYRKEKYFSQMTDSEKKAYSEGKIIYENTGSTYSKKIVDSKTGQVRYEQRPRLAKTTRMADTDDAYSLSSGTEMESVYADYANAMKALANEARKEMRATQPMKVNSSAKKTYSNEIASLDHKLNIYLKNKPLERRAQIIANKTVAEQFKANPDLEDTQKKRLKGQALDAARHKMGKDKGYSIEITDKEWEAIQNGAISQNKLDVILSSTDMDLLKQRAMPKERKAMSAGKLARAKALLASGNYTQMEVADELGVSVSTLRNNLNK